MVPNGNGQNGNGNGAVWRWVSAGIATVASFLLLWSASERRALEDQIRLSEQRVNARVDAVERQQREDRAEVLNRLDKFGDKLDDIYRMVVNVSREQAADRGR